MSKKLPQIVYVFRDRHFKGNFHCYDNELACVRVNETRLVGRYRLVESSHLSAGVVSEPAKKERRRTLSSFCLS